MPQGVSAGTIIVAKGSYVPSPLEIFVEELVAKYSQPIEQEALGITIFKKDPEHHFARGTGEQYSGPLTVEYQRFRPFETPIPLNEDAYLQVLEEIMRAESTREKLIIKAFNAFKLEVMRTTRGEYKFYISSSLDDSLSSTIRSAILDDYHSHAEFTLSSEDAIIFLRQHFKLPT